ncbi:MAG: hypothetical protein K0S56_3055 [Microvirga sp.]|jgi:hypothetical protein|nr:hypothetical protein [Microvirga sp.]
MMRRFVLAAVGAVVSMPVLAWDGYDYDKGAFVEIDKGNLVRQGREIEFYDYDAGEYRYLEIDNIYRSGGGRGH